MRSHEEGFIGFEAVVAFAILTLALVVLYQAISGGYHVTARTSLEEQALEEARSFVAALSAQDSLQAGTRSGRFQSGIRWNLSVTRMPGTDSGVDPAGADRLWIDLEAVDSKGGPLVRLKTIVLSTAKE